MIRRLRVKFICINMAIVTVMMLAILGMLLRFTRNDLEQQSIRVMQSVMEDRAYPSRPGEFPRQAKLPYFYVSVNTMGELSASFGGYYDLTNTEAIQEIITLALNSDDQTGILKDYSLRFQKRTTPFGQTIVFVDMSSELATMRSLTDTCILIGVLGFAVFLGLSFLLARWAVKPVETAWNQQRQFVADASHELKTPVTILKGQLAGMLEGVGVYQDRDKYLLRSLQVTARMENLIQEMLAVSRVETRGADVRREPVELSTLLVHQLTLDAELMEQRGQRLVSTLTPGITVTGDTSLLGKAIGNLLSNASLYSPEGAEIRVWCGRMQGRTALTVENTGTHIGAEALPHLFEAFYREEASRNRSTGGSGLGLYLVRIILERHGASCSIENTAEGVKATVHFGDFK